MSVLITGLFLFFVPHSVSIVNEPWRNHMAATMGERRWQGLYSVVATAGLVLMAWGYDLAREEATLIYAPSTNMRHVAWLLLIPVFPLLIATYVPGRIRAATKHPMLQATMIWAAAHLLANGSVADLLLFGTFLLWAIADRISMSRRTQRPLPEVPSTRLNDVVVVIAGLGTYLAFLFGLHGWLIGVPLIR